MVVGRQVDRGFGGGRDCGAVRRRASPGQEVGAEAVRDADAKHEDIASTETRWPFPCHSSLAPAMQNTTTALVGEVSDGERERHVAGGAVFHGEVGDGGCERYAVGGAVCHREVGDGDCEQHTTTVSAARCSSKQDGEREGSIFNKDN